MDYGRIISIHAPVRGATYAEIKALSAGDISIHAPVWGATLTRMPPEFVISFQFTPPCGGRPFALPGWGAFSANFNSRPRVGGDWQKL